MRKEDKIEQRLITKLQDLKYVYRGDIKDRYGLEKNFKQKFEQLNKVRLTEKEFARLREEIIKPDAFESSKYLRQKHTFTREDGTPLQYTLVDIKNWCRNEFEVINQLRINTENTNQRYDVIILINGIPMVQIELKALYVNPRRAIEQIVNYKNEPGNGFTNTLLSFMQLFIVSNQANTYYFSNNKNEHFKFNADEQFLPVYHLADRDNNKITHLDKFTDKFLAKCKLAEMISLYMVLVESERKILVMRPYQIYAVKAIIKSIKENRGNGYIWHTTGSGKTLTSFKASTLLKDNPDIEKCLFVVDRKDLDRQTREEFNKFQEGSVEENTNTETLVRRMLSTNYKDKVIVTTIQKLGIALDGKYKKNYKERLAPLKDKRVVFIFDECHRSQFGDNHKAIKEYFPNVQLFGFTGTPIFEKNANYIKIDGIKGSYKTTEDVFQKELHNYTITHAIEDKNVLRFQIDYYKGEGNANPRPGEPIAQRAVVEAILQKHEKVTNHRKFNALLATASINNAIDYYHLFKNTQAKLSEENPDYQPLNVACVFSPPAEGNADIAQLQEDLEQEKIDNQEDPKGKKEALTAIIKDYNRQYNTNYSISEFDAYYQDIQQRIKDQKYTNKDYPHKNKIDVTIVVDMLLTGFDSKYLNTLYVDKNLKYHGLIQAFSRTNRVLNDTKPNGNILDFRFQEESVDEAIALFSGKQSSKKVKEIWLVEPAEEIIKKYEKAVEQFQSFLKSEDENMVSEPETVYNLKGDIARVKFIQDFKEVQRLKTQLDQYTGLTPEQEDAIEHIMPKDDLLTYRGMYLDSAKRLRVQQQKHQDNLPEEIQKLDFEFVLFASSIIDYDYIMKLIADYTQQTHRKHKMTKEELIDLLGSSSNLMEEKEDIRDFINNLELNTPMTEEQIKEDYQAFKEEKENKELIIVAEKHKIPLDHLKSFTEDILKRMIFDGEKLSELMQPLNLGWKERATKEIALMEDLVPLLNKKANDQEIAGLAVYEK